MQLAQFLQMLNRESKVYYSLLFLFPTMGTDDGGDVLSKH